MSYLYRMPVCSNCGNDGVGNYCSECGKHYTVTRVTISSILHEVSHIFTHFEHGFIYSFRRLLTQPGQMQKDYISGHRTKHQKPFSMFFVCATFAALTIYYTTKTTSADTLLSETTAHFTKHYYVILQTALLPLYAFLTWLLFRNKNFNYAEALVLTAYTLAFVLLLVIPVNLINLIPHHIETTFVEIPVLAVYFILTNLRFFETQPSWVTIVKTLAMLLTGFFIFQWIANLIIQHLL
jgi:hypothetical protein